MQGEHIKHPYEFPNEEFFPPPKPPEKMHSLGLFWLMLAGLIAAFIFSFLLAWYFTRPINILRSALSAMASGNLDTRVSHSLKSRNDELSDLGNSFDEMASKIQQLVTTQQQLLHDVSHELRSPLARMQAAIGIAQKQSDKVPVTLERLEKDAQRMSDLIGELLLLSKMESGVQHQEFQQVSLNILLEEIIDDAHIEAQTKQISINLNLKQEFILEVQPSLLHRAIENIIRNAIKYSSKATEVTVDVHETPSMIEIHIKDQGPGINEFELDQVFKPFYRAGQRRENDSVGLGLAIAYRAIKSHGGYITASNRVDGGLCVTVYLPKKLIVTN
jgi:two-component system OmpR family sensor kinase